MTESQQRLPVFSDVRSAAERITPYVHRTPVLTSASMNQLTGAKLFFKCENFQKVGAFKFRGACNALFSYSSEELRNGVATHSSGNHAQAVALAARIREVPAHIVMPENAPSVKIQAVRSYGADITFCEPTLKAREATLDKILTQNSAVFIHPSNDVRVIAGQGTAALEMLEDYPDVDCVIAPVGGGGLLSGTALAVHGINSEMSVSGAEPEGADDAFRSLEAGRLIRPENPQSVADGLLTSLGDLTFPIIRNHVEQIFTVCDHKIIEAMRLIWERMKIVIEPSAAVPVAVLKQHPEIFSGKRVGVILSGGNADLDSLPWNNT